MKGLTRTQTNPYFNIAAEEFIFKKYSEDLIMIWHNEPSVIIGKHQNAFSEIDHTYISKNQLPVIRRITGGGTVYHDLGNLNYSFLFNRDTHARIDYIENTRGVIEALKHLGLDARLQDTSNITVNGIKVSGNSLHIFKNKILHHGTLLFSTNLDILDRIRGSKLNVYKDKAVRSVRKEVANISDILEHTMSFHDFKNIITAFLYEYYQCEQNIELDGMDQVRIVDLITKKYNTWEWNYGYSPEFTLSKNIGYEDREYTLQLTVKEGNIKSIHYDGKDATLDLIIRKLQNQPFRIKVLEEKINSLTFAEPAQGELAKMLIRDLF